MQARGLSVLRQGRRMGSEYVSAKAAPRQGCILGFLSDMCCYIQEIKEPAFVDGTTHLEAQAYSRSC
jgi:hypothetical protein